MMKMQEKYEREGQEIAQEGEEIKKQRESLENRIMEKCK